jgi:hypothetical protein
LNFPNDIKIEDLRQIIKYLKTLSSSNHAAHKTGVSTNKRNKGWVQNDGPILFEYIIGKVVSKILDLPFYSTNTFKRTKHFVKWNGSTDKRSFRKAARGPDIIAKARGHIAIIDVTLNARPGPQISRELGSFLKHLETANRNSNGDRVVGIFVVPTITERVWELYKTSSDATIVLINVANLAKIYSIFQVGIPVQHAYLFGFYSKLSLRLKNSRNMGDYLMSLNDLTKLFVRDFLRSEYDFFLSIKVYSLFRNKDRIKLSQEEIIDDLKKDPYVKELNKLMGVKTKKDKNIRAELTNDLNQALKKYKLVILDESPFYGDPIYLKPDCEDSKYLARVIDSIC